MHVVHVMTRLAGGGSEENTFATCRWQIAHGLRVTLIHGGPAQPVPGIDTVALPELVHRVRLGTDLAAMRGLAELYDTLRPDVVHTHQSKAGIVGRLAARGRRLRVVHGIHIVPFERVSPVKRHGYITAERLAARVTDTFLSVSQAAAGAFVKARIAMPGQMHVVRSGMDLARFRTAVPPSDRLALTGPGFQPVAVMLASLEPRKRHVPFLEAFARIRPEMRVVLAGEGPERARIAATIARLGLGDRVVLAGHRPDPESLLAMADFSVLASEREGLPRVVIQSLAAGTPVVSADLPGLSEVLLDGVNGMVTPADDLEGLVRAMSVLADRAPLRARLSRGAGATDLSDWALDALGARTTDLYSHSRPRWALA
ncbi:glycosyltransferase [Palleronia rufa]|uniref:glycosyltransferase n=1 Tax=Palleronia rufa TaxID=1530186 RepID=UPI00068CB513|nr:glycosyltransferase [Palleronia rufa]